MKVKRFDLNLKRGEFLTYLSDINPEESLDGKWCRYEDVTAAEFENRNYWIAIANDRVGASLKAVDIWRSNAIVCLLLFLVTFAALVMK